MASGPDRPPLIADFINTICHKRSYPFRRAASLM
jgi:hypothetical protein